MTWEQIWTALSQLPERFQFPPAFRRWIESVYGDTSVIQSSADLVELANALMEEYPSWEKNAADPLKMAKPWQPSIWLDADGETSDKYEPGKTVGYINEKGVPTPLSKEFQPQPSEPMQGEMPDVSSDKPFIWNGKQWVQNPYYISPEEREADRLARIRAGEAEANALVLQRAKLALEQQKLAEERADRSAQMRADWYRTGPDAQRERAYEDALAKWRAAKPDDTARNWINTWKYQQSTPPASPFKSGGNREWSSDSGEKMGFATSQADAERRGLTSWTPHDWTGTDKGAMWQDTQRQKTFVDPRFPEGRMETDEEYDYRVNTLRLQAAAGSGDGVRPGATGNPYIASALAEWYKYNPGYIPTQKDISNWTAGQAYGAGLSPEEKREAWLKTPEGQKWSEGRRGYIQGQEEDWARMIANTPRGPKLPTWAAGLGAPTQSLKGNTYLDMSKFPKKGAASWFRPVSATKWSSLAPSEQSGVRGLAEAAGYDWEDYMDKSSKQWYSSRSGQLGRRQVRAY